MSRFRKRVVAQLGMPYALGRCLLDGEECLVAATEGHGPVLLSRPPFTAAAEMLPGPGGCMALVQSPAGLFSIMGCFVGYKFQTGAIYRIAREPEGGVPAGPWRALRILDLPFAHRIELIERGGAGFLVAATIAEDKKDAADWSRAGTVYAAAVPGSPEKRWALQPVLQGIHRNHGLISARYRGRRSLLVAGAEGLFAADLAGTAPDWGFQRVMDREISELALFDVDSDGRDELITIEPFHGSSLRVYREAGTGWEAAWEGRLDFGHCLVAGNVNAKPSLLVSSRSGSRDLIMLRWGRAAPGERLGEPATTIVERGAAAANMLVLTHAGRDLVFAANQAAGEIACYEEEA